MDLHVDEFPGNVEVLLEVMAESKEICVNYMVSKNKPKVAKTNQIVKMVDKHDG